MVAMSSKVNFKATTLVDILVPCSISTWAATSMDSMRPGREVHSFNTARMAIGRAYARYRDPSGERLYSYSAEADFASSHTADARLWHVLLQGPRNQAICMRGIRRGLCPRVAR